MRAFIVSIIVLLCSLCPLSANALPKDCIVINIPSRTLDLYKDGKIKKTYPVGVGMPNFPTPVGNFKVISKVIEPGWENPYKAAGYSRIKSGNTNPLGTRWIGFKADPKGEYGIHGTDNPSSVGKLSSHGCVRMHIKDAEEIFDKVDINTAVIVSYDTAKISVSNSKVFIETFPDVYRMGKSDINTIKNAIKNMKYLVLWNASIALQALNNSTTVPVKIGTIIDESDFY